MKLHFWDSVEELVDVQENVKKYIFKKGDAIAESVLYGYPDYDTRTVMCISVSCGCAVGCTFCGTGKFYGRNLTTAEIIEQVQYMKNKNVINFDEVQKLQIMFMSMGEPLLNAFNVSSAIDHLSLQQNAQLLLSTIAPNTKDGWNAFMQCAISYKTVGLQFSVHESTDEARNKIIPFPGKHTLEEIALRGVEFFRVTGRKPFFNYCVKDTNSSKEDALRLRMLFDPRVWECTLSVICSADQTMNAAINEQLTVIDAFNAELVNLGFNTRVFNPAGQDTIGGGCGQLFSVQQFAKNNPHIMHQSAGNKYLIKSTNV